MLTPRALFSLIPTKFTPFFFFFFFFFFFGRLADFSRFIAALKMKIIVAVIVALCVVSASARPARDDATLFSAFKNK